MRNSVIDSTTFDKPGDLAGQMAAAPLKGKKVNRFEAIYPIHLIQFEDDVQDAGKPWNDGTVSQTLAQARLIMWAGGPFVQARIVRLTKDGNKKLDLQFPSSGGAFRRPMITTPDDESKREFAEFRASCAAKWKTLRIEAVKSGASKIKAAATATGVQVTDDDLKDLGID